MFLTKHNTRQNDNMIVKTCLLISDDPDDHIEFSEALNEVSEQFVMITVSDVGKAIDFLVHKKCVPELVLLNLGIADFSSHAFFCALDGDPLLQDIRIVAYGDTVDSQNVELSRVNRFIHNDVTFSELKKELASIVASGP